MILFILSFCFFLQGLTSVCYDRVNDMIWGWNHQYRKIERWRNRNFAPIQSTSNPFGYPSTEEDISNTNPLTLSRIPTLILAELDRINSQHLPSIYLKAPPRLPEVVKLKKEMFGTELTSETFSTLVDLLSNYSRRFLDSEGENVENIFFANDSTYRLMCCLRLLKRNIYALSTCTASTISQIGLTHTSPFVIPSSSGGASVDFLTAGSPQSVLDHLRHLLLSLYLKSPKTRGRREVEAIQKEAFDVLSLGWSIFFAQQVDLLKYFFAGYCEEVSTQSLPSDGPSLQILQTLLQRLIECPRLSFLFYPPSPAEFSYLSIKDSHLPQPNLEELEKAEPAKFISSLLSFLQQRTHDRLKKGHSGEEMSQGKTERLLQTLVLALHRDLSTRALRMLKPVAAEYPFERRLVAFKSFSSFSIQFLNVSSELFSQAIKLASSVSTLPEKVILSSLQRSFFGELLPSILLSLLWLEHPFSANDFLPTMTSLLLELDKLNSRLSDSVSFPIDHFAITEYKVDQRTIESQHPYCNSGRFRFIDQGQVKIPGASFLTLKFDRRCLTDNSDTLAFYLNPEHKAHIAFSKTDELGGQTKMTLEGKRWPKGEYRIPGDSLYWVFNVNSGYRYFGFRCVVAGYLPTNGKGKMNSFSLNFYCSWLTPFCLSSHFLV
jgi:hypothetical protein